ncbi:MAG: ABC transporter ATP-binding protein [Geminicoccaceae bacterium]
MARIELDRVSKRWGDNFALEPTSLLIEDGEFVAVLGPSGCGKTTTLLLLAGIYEPSSGEIRFDGAPVNEVEAKDRNVGIVFQSYALYPHMTVRQNILFPLRFKRASAEDKDRRLAEAATLVQIEGLLDRLPSQLSGGQQQRVALARALVKAPQLLLLDEPLSNLDASLRLSMRSEIRRLQRRTGVTTILVTHDQIEATTMADRIVCMRHGRIEQIGTADELYGRPASLFVASFIGAPPINLITGRAENGAFRADRLALAVEGEAEGDAVLGVRPEAVRLGAGPLAGVVEAVEPMGRETLYVLDTPLGTLRALEAGAQRSLGQGDHTQLGFAESDTLLFDAASERRLSARVRLAS